MINKEVLLTIVLSLILIKPVTAAEDIIPLSDPSKEGGMPLMEALNRRQSGRSFSSERLSSRVLSDLLWSAFGVSRPDSGKRTAPSAKNAQEIDVYVAAEDGVFKYDAVNHGLERISSEDIRAITGKQGFTSDAPVVLIYVADMSKFSREEAGLYTAVDTGFISQNVYLYSASQGLSTVILGWIDREAISEKLELPSGRKVMFTQPVGYPKP